MAAIKQRFRKIKEWLKEEKHRQLLSFGGMILKYLITLIFIILGIHTTHSGVYALVSLCELGIIFLGTDLLLSVRYWAGYLFNVIGMLFLNIQLIILIFGNTFLSLIMVTNIAAAEDLAGRAGSYAVAVIFVIISTFLPVHVIGREYLFHYRRIEGSAIAILALADLIFVIGFGTEYSPYVSYATLIHDGRDYQKQMKLLEEQKNEVEPVPLVVTENGSQPALQHTDSPFYSEEIGDYREKDEGLPDQPNVILIFLEGVSQNVIDDERNIMSNIAEFQKESLTFQNYFNHTAATYRGLIGQLYSGYQLEDMDANDLVSIQSILKNEGYQTAFINTEPYKEDFTAYLDHLGFDEVTGEVEGYKIPDEHYSYSDNMAYQILWDKAEELSESPRPFFLSIYTFATHASMQNKGGAVFGDGSDPELNKFYNADVQFANFLKNFKKSELSKNTILVLTSDHCTYSDDAFVRAFPDYQQRGRGFLDDIPLCIYYDGIEPEVVEADGRNSLDLAPTLLDLMDISVPNFFLGKSLFAEPVQEMDFERIWYCLGDFQYTDGQGARDLTDEEKKEVESKVQEYFMISRE